MDHFCLSCDQPAWSGKSKVAPPRARVSESAESSDCSIGTGLWSAPGYNQTKAGLDGAATVNLIFLDNFLPVGEWKEQVERLSHPIPVSPARDRKPAAFQAMTRVFHQKPLPA